MCLHRCRGRQGCLGRQTGCDQCLHQTPGGPLHTHRRPVPAPKRGQEGLMRPHAPLSAACGDSRGQETHLQSSPADGCGPQPSHPPALFVCLLQFWWGVVGVYALPHAFRPQVFPSSRHSPLRICSYLHTYSEATLPFQLNRWHNLLSNPEPTLPRRAVLCCPPALALSLSYPYSPANPLSSCTQRSAPPAVPNQHPRQLLTHTAAAAAASTSLGWYLPLSTASFTQRRACRHHKAVTNSSSSSSKRQMQPRSATTSSTPGQPGAKQHSNTGQASLAPHGTILPRPALCACQVQGFHVSHHTLLLPPPPLSRPLPPHTHVCPSPPLLPPMHDPTYVQHFSS